MDGPVGGPTEPFRSGHPGPGRESSGRRRRETRGLTLLVVDDEPAIRSLYRAWLAPQHTVRTAGTGREALERFDADADVDVVVVDRRLPGTSGDHLLRSLAERRPESAARVVVVSAREPDLDIVDLPFDAYLTKPVDRGALRGAVEWAHRHENRPASVAAYLVLDHKVRLLEESAVTVELESEPAFRRLRERRTVARRRGDTEVTAAVSRARRPGHPARE